jgi:hypothetical protein
MRSLRLGVFGAFAAPLSRLPAALPLPGAALAEAIDAQQQIVGQGSEFQVAPSNI